MWILKKAGSLKKLTRMEQDLPKLNPGEVKVSVKAIGLNFADIFAIQKLYSATPKGAFVPGLEFAGVIMDKSRAAQGDFQLGDRVMGVTRFGAYSDEVNINSSYLWKLPETWSCKEGAAFPVQSLTAWHGLVTLGNLQSKKTVLVHSAAGGVGYWAMEIITAVGAIPICTVGNKEKVPFLMDHFAMDDNQIIVRSKKRFKSQLRTALGSINQEGFDLVFDAVYGPFFKPAYQLIKPGGRHILYGAANMMSPRDRPNYMRLLYQYLKRYRPDPLDLISDNRSVMGFNLIWLWDEIQDLRDAFREMLLVVDRKPYVDRVFTFKDIKKAIRYLQSGTSKGKIVIELS